MSADSLPPSARDRLLGRVDQIKTARAEGRDGAAEAELAGFTDFSTLPGYDKLRLQRDIGRSMDLWPYLRTHEFNAGGRTQIDGRSFINFSSYDYLGLNEHPQVKAAAMAQIDRDGVSPGASRHVGGERPVHLSLERKLARHYGAENAVAFVSGYATNLGVIGELLGPKDLVIVDSAVHDSVVRGAVLSGAQRRAFGHNDLDHLEELLKTSRRRFERVLIIVEGVYGMDGDIPDLARLVEIKRRHHAWLMIDEAHALGVIGARGHGVFEHCGVDPADVDIWMGTLSKTLAGCGGYIAGSEALTHYLRCKVGAFVFSVAMPPAVAAAAETALDLLYAEPERVARLQAVAERFGRRARERGLNLGTSAGTAVAPILVRGDLSVTQVAKGLYERGVNVQPVVYPAVPAEGARLRFFLTASHTDEDIAYAVDAAAEEIGRLDPHGL